MRANPFPPAAAFPSCRLRTIAADLSMEQRVRNGLRYFRVSGRTAVLLAALAACGGGDGPTEPVATTNSMSFAYSGAVSGSFDVSGEGGPGDEGASGFKFAGPRTMLTIGGVKKLSATRATLMQLILPDVTAPRTFNLSDDVCLDFNTTCPLAAFAPDIEPGPPSLSPDADLDEFYLFTSGTVVVTSVSATRITGTFAGTAETLSLEGPPKTVTISNGKFDVAVTSLD